jgi:hypothetical protein
MMGGPPRGHRMSEDEADQVLQRGASSAPQRPAARQQPAVSLQMPPLVPGHVRAVELLEQVAAVRDTVELYRQHLGHDVYLRPTGQGLTVLSLDPAAQAMIGVGALTALMPSRALIEEQLNVYGSALTAMRRVSLGEQLSVRWLRHALRAGLSLPGTNLHLVCQEWRFPLYPSGSAKLDLLAVDLRQRRLVVIELKSTATSAGVGGTAQQQAERYARWLHDGRQFFTPFFQRMARAMARAYDGPQEMQTLTLIDAAPPTTRIVFADGHPA